MALPFPPDVFIEIASYLRPRDQGALVACCWILHNVLAPLVYRRLDVWFQPPAWEKSDGYDPTPYCLLTTLAKSGRFAKFPLSTRCYARYVVTFAYSSHGRKADLRALPLLTEFLRFATRLRHLRIDVPLASVPLVIDQFRRHSIICAPPTSFTAMYLGTQSAATRLLPSLESVRSSSATLVEVLMRYRRIRTAIVDGMLSTRDLDTLLSISSPLRRTDLMRLSLSISNPDIYDTIIRATVLSFPQLEHLSIRTSLQLTVPIIHVSIYLFLLTAHPSGAVPMASLKGFSVNYAGHGDIYTRTLRDAEQAVIEAGQQWASLQIVVLGDAMWCRSGWMAGWEFSVGTKSRAWTWLHNVNAGISCKVRLVLINRKRKHADLVVSRMSVVPSTPKPALSVFELFLLSSEDSVVDAFFEVWTPDVILRLRQLSSSMFSAVEAYCLRCWSIEDFLLRWFSQPSEFLNILGSCDGIVSGSEAQQFFGRGAFRGRDLDIYVPPHGLLGMGRWLKEQGFVYQASSDRHPFFDVAALMCTSHMGRAAVDRPPRNLLKSTAFSTFSFVRPANWRENPPFTPAGKFVQVVVVPDDPVAFIISNFHSTGVMNYFTHRYAVALFPHLTFIHNMTLVCQDTSRNAYIHRAWMKKYKKRGFTIVAAGDRLPDALELRAWRRRVGDRHSWTIPFQRQGSPPSTSWSLGLFSHHAPFEVLPYHYEVATAGAALRVGARFVHSSMAALCDPRSQIGVYYNSIEIEAAFTEYFGVAEADEIGAVDSENEDAVSDAWEIPWSDEPYFAHQNAPEADDGTAGQEDALNNAAEEGAPENGIGNSSESSGDDDVDE
ncbi:hypothetical protein C2E23DRAFT_738973 [Lenzites betulinus]|nr:hypothetical protein C2E23DRAFT_738973 [Lenzites betulinus]